LDNFIELVLYIPSFFILLAWKSSSYSMKFDCGLQLEDSAKVIASTLLRSDKKSRKVALDLLTVMGLFSPEGHRNVLAAWSYLKMCKRHKNRFQFLMDIVAEAARDADSSLATTCMGLVNTVVNFPDDIFIRIQLRGELDHLMLSHYEDELRLLLDERLDVQLDLYHSESEVCNFFLW
jgi:hypothetical protein